MFDLYLYVVYLIVNIFKCLKFDNCQYLKIIIYKEKIIIYFKSVNLNDSDC